jgi:invasion protein IalB
MYEDEGPRRRRSIVPLLVVIALVLAVIVVGAGALAYLGYFNRAPGAGTITTQAPAQTSTMSSAATGNETASNNPIVVPQAVVSVAPATQGEPPVRSTHGDWQVRCDTPAGAQTEQCVLMQFVTAEDRDNVGLTVIILKTADKKAQIMRVIAPLGVLLPSGLGLKIDSTDMGRAGFVRCQPSGCVAEVVLEDKLLTALRSGTTATFIIFQTPEEGIGIPISLNGFGEGFDALP